MTRKRYQKLMRALFVSYYQERRLSCSEKVFHFRELGEKEPLKNYAEIYSAVKEAIYK